ncbi:MAG: metal ABC transporter substrate-binding protein [Candidatus Kapaibacteriales bacterium]
MPFIYILLEFLLVLMLGCNQPNKGKVILTSGIPVKLIIQEITKDKIPCDALVPLGVSLHTFQPKPSDISKVENSLIFFYISDFSEPWISKKFEKKVPIFDLLPEEYRMKFEDGQRFDAHFWTDPLAVFSIVDTIAAIISNFDPLNTQYYKENASEFKEKLKKLVLDVDSTLSEIKGSTVFLFHPSFRYYLKRFGLVYGGSVEEVPGREPSPTYLMELTERIRNSSKRVVFSEPQLNPNSVKMLAEASDAELFQIDPIGGNLETNTYEKLIWYNTYIFLKAFKK